MARIRRTLKTNMYGVCYPGFSSLPLQRNTFPSPPPFGPVLHGSAKRGFLPSLHTCISAYLAEAPTSSSRLPGGMGILGCAVPCMAALAFSPIEWSCKRYRCRHVQARCLLICPVGTDGGQCHVDSLPRDPGKPRKVRTRDIKEKESFPGSTTLEERYLIWPRRPVHFTALR